MIAVAAVARQWLATLLGLLLLFVALVIMLAELEERRPSYESFLEGIPADEITGGGITIDRAPQKPDLPVTPDAAVTTSSPHLSGWRAAPGSAGTPSKRRRPCESCRLGH